MCVLLDSATGSAQESAVPVLRLAYDIRTIQELLELLGHEGRRHHHDLHVLNKGGHGLGSAVDGLRPVLYRLHKNDDLKVGVVRNVFCCNGLG
ncbi:MAG: hypothetical protein KF693_11340 [Nitrospira sp.]|nr:hypothetical protein [Nitrospira sp.]